MDLSSSRLPITMQGWVLFENVFIVKQTWIGEVKLCVCVVLKTAGFKSKCKPRAFLRSKTIPPWWKAYHLQREFDSTPPQWGARMATRTRRPIRTPHHKLPFIFLNISLLLFFLLKMCWLKNNYNILSFSWIFQPSVNSVIPQKIADGWIILIFIFILCQADNH